MDMVRKALHPKKATKPGLMIKVAALVMLAAFVVPRPQDKHAMPQVM